MDFMQFFDMLLHVDKSLEVVIQQYGTLVYVVLFAIIFCETGLVVLFFFPGDSLLFIAGAFCASGDMNLLLLNVLLVTAAVTGNTLNYKIGGAIGHRVYTHDYRWLNKDALRRTHDFFEKHGGKTIVLARFVPVVRTFAPLVAGVSEMPHGRFQLYNISGALLWVVSLTMAGYFFGNIPVVRDHLSEIVMVAIGVVMIPILLGGAWRLGRRVIGR